MIVIVLSVCPPKVRGFLTGWFQEIDTGVFVGNVSNRVREEVWKLISGNIGSGRAIMAYSTNNEQGLNFQTLNSSYEPIDFDGIKLVRRPSHKKSGKKGERKTSLPEFYGIEYYMQRKQPPELPKPNRESRNRRKESAPIELSAGMMHLEDYTAVDLETGGLDPEHAPIIEFGAVRIRNHQVVSMYRQLVRIDTELDSTIIELTGITNELLEKEGVPIRDALTGFLNFIGEDTIVGHNLKFDLNFLRYNCKVLSFPEYSPAVADTWIMSKQQQPGVSNYRLSSLIQFFGIAENQQHRALEDALLVHKLYEKLNEK